MPPVVAWYCVSVFPLTHHEPSRALAAQWCGDLRAAKNGQVTLGLLHRIRRKIFAVIIAPIAAYVLGRWMIGWGSRQKISLQCSGGKCQTKF
jgi:hypothetical protein